MPTDFIAVFSVLATARARFVIVGGLALLLRGIDRLTADVDIAIDLSAASALGIVDALVEAGYRPMAPVDARWLADPARREAWQSQREMKVFSFWDPGSTRPTVDIMLSPAVSFEELWTQSDIFTIVGVAVRVASVEHLIALKTAAGRPQDLADIERLQALKPR